MLFCSSEEGIPTPSYSWEKLDALPRLPHNAMQGITNKLAIGVPFCPNFAGKCYTHGWAPAPLMLHHLCHLSCARPTSLLTHSRWSWWGWKWMDGRERSPVLWMIVPMDGINPEDGSTSVFLGSFFFFHAEHLLIRAASCGCTASISSNFGFQHWKKQHISPCLLFLSRCLPCTAKYSIVS